MGKTIRIVLLLLVGAVLGAGGYHVYSGITAGAEVAGSYEEKTLVPAEVEEALRSDDPTQRAAGMSQIEVMEPAKARAVLMELTAHEFSPVRLTAVNGLGKHHASDAEVVKTLGDVLSLDPDVDVRLSTIHALSRSGTVAGLSAIVVALSDDPTLVVRREAAVALDKLTGRSTAAALSDSVEQAEGAADDLLMDWEEWLDANRAKLTWDAAAGKFVGGE